MSEQPRSITRIVERVSPPVLLLGGLLLVAFSLAPWCVGDEGVKPSVSGLGKVQVAGASSDDVAFLEEHTLRPGMITVFAGAVIAVAAVVLWWRRSVFWPSIVVIVFGALAALVQGVTVFADPAPHIFDELVVAELAGELPALSPAYGLYGIVIVSVVTVVVAAVAIIVTLRSRGLADAVRGPGLRDVQS